MIDVRIDSIIYQSQIYYRNLVNTLVDNKKLGKALDPTWEKVDLILGYLEALNYRSRLTDEDDITNVNYILECLIKLCELYQYPISPAITFQEAPDILFGIEGPPGDSITGPTGATGLATDFQVSLVAVPTIVDSFDISDANGARWDYTVIQSTGEQRSGSIIGTWSADGASIEFNDNSTADIVGSTAGLEFNLQFSGGDIQLLAVPTSGLWNVVGSRYFIPNNGNGSGPISDVLADGKIFIGNSSNVATARTVTGVISITNAGVTSFTAGSIVNADINASAAIAVSKLAVLTASRVVGTNSSGVLTILDTATYPSLAELSYVKGVTSALQTQLGTKLTDPTTTIGDIIIRNGSGNVDRLAIGSNTQVLTVTGGLPAWGAAPGGISGGTSGVITKYTSATTIGNSIMTESSSTITLAGDLVASLGLTGQDLTTGRVLVSTTGGKITTATMTSAKLEVLDIYETTDGNNTMAEATQPYQFLMRNSDNTGYTFVSLATLKTLLDNI